MAVKVESSKGDTLIQCEDAILNEKCPYILVPLGRLGLEKGVKVEFPGGRADGYFQYPNGVRIRMINRNVWIVVDYKAAIRPPIHALLQLDPMSSDVDIEPCFTEIILPAGVIQGKRVG